MRLRAFAASTLTVCACGTSGAGVTVGPIDPESPSMIDGAAEVPCDPLAATPTTLSNVLGVGLDATGTTYVVDQGAATASPTNLRVFVKVGGALVRQHVIGSGGTGASESIVTFESADGSVGPRDLDILVSGGKATSMTLGPEGSAKSRIEGLDAGAPTSLTLVGPSMIAGLSAIDLPDIVLYVADGADGTAIAIVEPLENASPARFHLFFGPPDAMQERQIVSFEQALSGFPTIGFWVGAHTYVMAISSLPPPPDGGLLNVPGPVTVTEGAQSVAFTLRMPTPTTLAGFGLACLAQ